MCRTVSLRFFVFSRPAPGPRSCLGDARPLSARFLLFAAWVSLVTDRGGSWSQGPRGFQQLSCCSPESVSAASYLCSLTGCFRFDVFLYLESGSTVAMVSAVAACCFSWWIWAPTRCSLFGSVARFPCRYCFRAKSSLCRLGLRGLL